MNRKVDTYKLVQSIYDKIASRYTKEREAIDNWNEINEFCSMFTTGTKILDIGCGTGIPVTEYLVKSGYEVVGIDISNEMIKAAKGNVQGATFKQMNMIELDFPQETFDALISCYALFHTPREKHADIFNSFYSLLKVNGTMLLSIGAGAWEEVESYHGEEMFWSHFEPEETEKLINDAGFDILFNRVNTDGGEKHNWLLAKKVKYLKSKI